MHTMKFGLPDRERAPVDQQKNTALSCIHEAWTEARLEGVEDDCMVQALLFTALAELVSTYGEEAAGKFTEGLPARIRNGEFSVELARQ